MAMNVRLLRPILSGDPDALRYIAAVQKADGATLEPAVKKAITDFVAGCKADGIWSAIKASCILMGARTITGALTPLVGTAPTNVNLVSGDYNRKNGPAGGIGKYIDTNRTKQNDPQDSCHAAIYVTVQSTLGFARACGVESATGRTTMLRSNNSTDAIVTHGANSNVTVNTGGGLAGFCGVNRASATAFTYRLNSTAGTANVNSQTRPAGNFFVLNVNPTNTTFSNGNIGFYSIGESLDLSLLDTRVSALVSAIGAAIP